MQAWQSKEIDTPRLKLRPLTLSDARAMFEIYSDADAMRYWSDEPVASLKEARAVIEADLALAKTGGALFWALEEVRTGRVIGKFTLMHYSEQNRRAEVGYILHRDYWRQGLMTEALAGVIEFAFGDLGLHRLEADTDVDNEASLALLEKLGFRQEGYFRHRWRLNGDWRDSVMFGLLEADWAQRPKLF